MEVIVTEEKKKIFRARKTMKISDRQQLESLHSTLLTVAPGLSNPSPPPLMNGTHKEDGQKVGDKEQNNILDLNTPQTTPPVSPTSLSSPAPSLTLNLSPSPPSSSPKASEENTAPRSPMDPLNFELKKVEEDEKKDGPTSDSSSSSPSHSASSCTDRKQSVEIKDEDIKEEETHKADVKKGSACEEKMEVDSVKVEPKKEKTEVGQTANSTSGLKRTLSEGSEKDGQTVKIEGKRPKMEREELEAQLELKITTKAGSHHKLGKIVQQLVEERLKMLELTIFDKHFQELKDRVDKIDCATKHQAAINTLQAKIARLSKKFGEANQASENKRKQESRNTSCLSFSTVVSVPTAASAAVSTPAAASAPTSSSSTAMVQQAPILQLITSNSNPASTLATGSTTQSQTGTLLLKTAPGSGMVATGQPLLIQLPLSVNGQAGTLVNIPVSSLSAASSLSKAKTTASTATFILKPAPATTTVTATAPAISLARAVYQGGAGGITTPNAGVSVTTARTPAQSVSVVGAMSSVSSPATSGPAATGSTAPGPPQGMSLTSKTGENYKRTVRQPTRPKGSVIDLTEDDDDVQGETSCTLFDTALKSRSVTTTTPTRGSSMALPPLPSAPAPPRLPPEAERTSPPQQPQLKLVQSQTGIVLSWCVGEVDRTCAAVESYHLYAFHQDNSNSNASQQHWKKIGEVKALPLPMACTLTQFQSGSTYHFAVRAKDVYGRFGSFCEPQCTNVISSSSS
uniref:Activating transcription factor 7 interacting protein n=1 Tax=Amphilophus citrinellus TaxID=61819 RepID=A0A3Q0QVZ9_AMPCI